MNKVLLKYVNSIILVLLILPIGKISAQVNTEVMRKSELEQGLRTTGSIALDLKKGNTDYMSFGAGLRFDYRCNTLYTFFVSNLKVAEKDETEFLNTSFIHLRIMREISRHFSTEIFTQIERNKFINLQLRRLMGGGLRILAVGNEEKFLLNLGIGAMYEGEQYTIPYESDNYLFRSTNYIAGRCVFNNYSLFLITGYLQPDFGDPTDFRFLLNSELEIQLSRLLTFSTTIEYRYDSQPSSDLSRYDLNVTNGIKLTF